MTGTWGFATLLPRESAIFDTATTASSDHVAVLALALGQVQRLVGQPVAVAQFLAPVQLGYAHADRHELRGMESLADGLDQGARTNGLAPCRRCSLLPPNASGTATRRKVDRSGTRMTGIDTREGESARTALRVPGRDMARHAISVAF